jgi:hypothetical protein
MHNQQHSINESYERLIKHIEAEYPLGDVPEDQHQVEQLLAIGFDWEEAVKLIDLREHLYESNEMNERIADNSRMLFVRWLYENGEINEN